MENKKINLILFLDWLNDYYNFWDCGLKLENIFEKNMDEINKNDLKDFDIIDYLINLELFDENDFIIINEKSREFDL